MWRVSDFAKLRRRSRADLDLLVEAAFWLAIAGAAIRIVPFRWTTRLFALRPGEDRLCVHGQSPELARRVGWALKIAAARVPWHSTCLARALAGAGMLHRRRIPATMAMGVAKSPAEPGGLEAHAWLSCAGLILTGAGGHERYQVVAQFTLGIRQPSRPVK